MKQSTIIMVVVGLVAVAIIGYFVMNMQSGNESTSMTQSESTAAASETATETMNESGTIIDVANNAGNFTTLVAAVQSAGLAETLSGEGPYTVFAPTDEAFAKLPAGTVDALLKDKEKLTQILTYHVVSGKVPSTDVVNLTEATTVQGGKVSISSENGSVMVNNAKVITTDIEASNGVIHVIDTVLMPQ